MVDGIKITGGADAEVTAAIIAVVSAIASEERQAAAIRPEPIHQSQWVRSGQSMEHFAPLHHEDQAYTASPSTRES